MNMGHTDNCVPILPHPCRINTTVQNKKIGRNWKEMLKYKNNLLQDGITGESVRCGITDDLPSLYFLNVVKRRRSHTRVSKFTFAVFPSTVTLSMEPSFTLTQSSPNMSLKGKAVLVQMHV